jgi:hypothetical protein
MGQPALHLWVTSICTNRGGKALLEPRAKGTNEWRFPRKLYKLEKLIIDIPLQPHPGLVIKEQVQFELSVQITVMAQGDTVSMALILRRTPQLHQTHVPDVAGRFAPAYKREAGEHVTVTID